MIYYFSESDALMLVDITLDTEKELDISLQIIRCREQSSGMQHPAAVSRDHSSQSETINFECAHLMTSPVIIVNKTGLFCVIN